MYLYQLHVFLYECLLILQCWLEFNRLKVSDGTWNDTLAKLESLIKRLGGKMFAERGECFIASDRE